MNNKPYSALEIYTFSYKMLKISFVVCEIILLVLLLVAAIDMKSLKLSLIFGGIMAGLVLIFVAISIYLRRFIKQFQEDEVNKNDRN